MNYTSAITKLVFMKLIMTFLLIEMCGICVHSHLLCPKLRIYKESSMHQQYTNNFHHKKQSVVILFIVQCIGSVHQIFNGSNFTSLLTSKLKQG